MKAASRIFLVIFSIVIISSGAFADDQLDLSLVKAVYAGNPALVRALLSQGANPNSEEAYFHSPVLIIATTLMGIDDNKRLDIVKALVEGKADVNIEQRSEKSWGYTALIGAANNGFPDVIRYLISKGARVNAVEQGQCPATALWLAAYTGRDSSVQVLIASKADLNFRGGCFNRTPLGIAKEYKRFSTAAIIAAAGGQE